VPSEDFEPREAAGSTWIRTYLVPLAALVIVVAVVSALVVTGVVKTDQPRVGPADAPTTLPTVEVVP